jgi:hypothetical protein
MDADKTTAQRPYKAKPRGCDKGQRTLQKVMPIDTVDLATTRAPGLLRRLKRLHREQLVATQACYLYLVIRIRLRHGIVFGEISEIIANTQRLSHVDSAVLLKIVSERLLRRVVSMTTGTLA